MQHSVMLSVFRVIVVFFNPLEQVKTIHCYGNTLEKLAGSMLLICSIN